MKTRWILQPLFQVAFFASFACCWDDSLILAATILVIALLCLSIVIWNAQAGSNDLNLDWDTILLLLLIFNVIYLFSVCLAKLSALCLYIRVFSQKRKFQLTCKIIGVIIAVLYIAVLAQEFTISGIAVELWHKSLGSLTDKKKVDVGTAFFSILGNIVVLVLPLPLIWQLQMSILRKISLTALFLSGLSVTVVSSFRLMAIINADYDSALVVITTRIMNLQVLEPELAIFSLCLPVLHRFWVKLWERCFGVRNLSEEVHRMSSINSEVKKEGNYDMRWDEFLRSGGYSRYSVDIRAGTPPTTVSHPVHTQPQGLGLTQEPRDKGPNQNTILPPINVESTWSVTYQASPDIY